MVVEIATTDSFKDIRRSAFIDALPETDFAAKALIDGLPPQGKTSSTASVSKTCRIPQILANRRLGVLEQRPQIAGPFRSYGQATPRARAGE
jgi:hypothetical protein